MSGSIIKRSIEIAGHRTSISLENEFWAALKDISISKGTTLRALIAQIDNDRGETNLSSAIRLHVLAHYRTPAEGR